MVKNLQEGTILPVVFDSCADCKGAFFLFYLVSFACHDPSDGAIRTDMSASHRVTAF